MVGNRLFSTDSARSVDEISKNSSAPLTCGGQRRLLRWEAAFDKRPAEALVAD